MGRSHGRWTKLATALAGVLLLVASACSKSSDSTPLTTIFVQQFKYHGVPATLPAGVTRASCSRTRNRSRSRTR